MTPTKKEQVEWRKTHLKNMIWSAKTKGSLFSEKDIPRFKKELKKLGENK